jgi:hypothetical protein
MKRATIVLLIGFIIVVFAGVAIAAEMSGEVTAVDAEGYAHVEERNGTGGFDCETGS